MTGMRESWPLSSNSGLFLPFPMSLWHQVQATSVFPGIFPWAALVFVVSALVLYAFRPADRLRIRHARFCNRCRPLSPAD